MSSNSNNNANSPILNNNTGQPQLNVLGSRLQSNYRAPVPKFSRKVAASSSSCSSSSVSSSPASSNNNIIVSSPALNAVNDKTAATLSEAQLVSFYYLFYICHLTNYALGNKAEFSRDIVKTLY